MNSTLKLVLVLSLVTFVFAQLPVESMITPCHDSCICASIDTECADCNICTECKSVGASIIDKSYCQCQTPEYRLKKDSDYECELVEKSVIVPVCEWQLFNQIYNMVVKSDCGIFKVEGENIIFDDISYDWQRSFNISKECQEELQTQLFIAKDCVNYVPLDTKYVKESSINDQYGSMVLEIPLIDVYQLTDTTIVSQRTISQRICFSIQLGHLRRTIREHRFEMRVFTNRDSFEVFHLTIEKQITEGCDKGQECIIVANLDTKGTICENVNCVDFKTVDVPKYIVGDRLFVLIEFKDNSYTKFLKVITVKFVDDKGIYNYVKDIQWWQRTQTPGKVIVEVLLFQPHVNALVEVSLKIAQQMGLRNLENNSEDKVKQDFNVQVKSAQAQVANAEDGSSFSAQIVCGLFALIAFIL